MYIRKLFAALLAAGLAGCRDHAEPIAPSGTAADSVSVVYSNFGAGMAFDTDPSHRWNINGDLGPGIDQGAISQRFTPLADFALNDVKIAVARSGGMDSLRVYVQQDAGGLPGSVLELIPVGGFGTTPVVVTSRSRIFPVLRMGSRYWVSVVAGGSGVVSGWNWNAIGNTSTVDMASTQGGSAFGPWSLLSPLQRSAFEVTGTPPAQGRKPITLDDVALVGPSTLVIDGPGLSYTVTVSNRTSISRAGIATQGWIEQAGARRAAGGQLVACSVELGVLPPGTCVRIGNSLSVSNFGDGGGTLVPGPATAVVAVVQLGPSSSQILDSLSFPVTLTIQQGVISGDVTPSDAQLFAIGDVLRLTANVQTIGVAPKTVLWASSNPAVAVVNSAAR